ELGLAGGNSAAPIWAEFMKRAIALPDYAQVQDFAPPDGVSLMAIDPVTLDRATPLCPVTRNEAFLAGSEPTRYCELHGGLAAVLAAAPASATPAAPGEDSASARAPAQPASAASQRGKPAARSPQKTPPGQTTDAQQPAPQKKKSIWDRIFGIFGSGKKKDQAPG